MGLLDFYEVRDFQQSGGQNLLNVYHYKKIDPGATATVVGTAFVESMLDTIRSQQPTTVTRTVVEVENFGSPFDFATIDTSAKVGTLVGENLATFNAATIQLNRTRNDMKNGAKRIMAGVETSVLGSFWIAAFLASLTTIADLMVTPIVLAATPLVDRAELVVLKRFCTIDPSPPCTGVYRLPNTDAEIDGFNYVPVTATARTTVRSQVSRKRLV